MKRTMRHITVAQAIVECFKQEQIRYVFGVPGESYLPLLDAIYDEPSIEFISARHEGVLPLWRKGMRKRRKSAASCWLQGRLAGRIWRLASIPRGKIPLRWSCFWGK